MSDSSASLEIWWTTHHSFTSSHLSHAHYLYSTLLITQSFLWALPALFLSTKLNPKSVISLKGSLGPCYCAMQKWNRPSSFCLPGGLSLFINLSYSTQSWIHVCTCCLKYQNIIKPCKLNSLNNTYFIKSISSHLHRYYIPVIEIYNRVDFLFPPFSPLPYTQLLSDVGTCIIMPIFSNVKHFFIY